MKIMNPKPQRAPNQDHFDKVIGYGIFSGGLDSLLASKLLQEQGIEVRLLTFSTPFFGPEKAIASARSIGLPLQVVDLTADHLEMMKNPKHGFGRFMNPCIDCHALMFRRAGQIMMEEQGQFLFSGEVLGQRPKSQNRRALDIVSSLSGFADYILRPLSARCLPQTSIEAQGLVDRSGLLGFQGRTRKPQMGLAEQYGLTDYPSPAGGCLLTDPGFSRRLRDIFDRNPDMDPRHIELLKWGRHFRLPGGSKLIVGRNHAENQAIERLALPGDYMFKAADFPGPTALGPGTRPDDDDLGLAADITLSYSAAPAGLSGGVLVIQNNKTTTITAQSTSKEPYSEFMVQ